MKKLSKVIAVTVFTLIPFAFGGSVAQAQQATCAVGYTGPDSNNMCTSTTNYQCSVTNTNTVTISNGSTQVVTSGNVISSNNTQSGSSTSGTVTNNNGTTFSVTITNGNSEDPTTGTCVATAIIPAVVPETPVTPTVQPTQGGGAEVLPKTGGDAPTTVLVIVVSSLAVLAILGVGGMALYRYYKSL